MEKMSRRKYLDEKRDANIRRYGDAIEDIPRRTPCKNTFEFYRWKRLGSECNKKIKGISALVLSSLAFAGSLWYASNYAFDKQESNRREIRKFLDSTPALLYTGKEDSQLMDIAEDLVLSGTLEEYSPSDVFNELKRKSQ